MLSKYDRKEGLNVIFESLVLGCPNEIIIASPPLARMLAKHTSDSFQQNSSVFT